MGRFSPTVKPHEESGFGNLAKALMAGVEGYRGSQDRHRAEEDRQLGRKIKTEAHGAEMRESDIDAAERGFRPNASAPRPPASLSGALSEAPGPVEDETAMPGVGLAGAMAGTPAGVPKSPVPGGFNPFTLQFDVPPVNPLEEIALPSGGVLDPNVPLRRSLAEKKATGLVGNEVAAAGRADVAGELEPALATVPGAPAGAARSPAAAADWLGRPPRDLYEPMMTVQGPDGKPVLVPRSQSAGMTPARVPTEVQVTAAARTRLEGISTGIAVADEVEKALRENPSAVGLKGVLWRVALDRLDPDGVGVRSWIETLTGELRHSRFGGALTIGEAELAKRWLPQDTDEFDAAIAKLNILRSYLRIKEGTLKSGQATDLTGGAAAPGAAAPSPESTIGGLSDLSPRSRRP